MTIRFDDAWTAITAIALTISRRGRDVVALRDMVGRISIIFDDRVAEVSPDDLRFWQDEMRAAAGKFCANHPTFLATQLFQPDEIFEDPDLLDISEQGEGLGRCALLERRVVGGIGAAFARNPRRDVSPCTASKAALDDLRQHSY